MSVTISDLQPKPFKINIKGLELECKPLRLSHLLIVSKIGQVLQKPEDASVADIKQMQKDMDEVLSELIPELAGVELDAQDTMTVITEMTSSVEPTDNRELKDNNVKIDNDPKVERIG